MSTIPKGSTVLVTGVNGYIASHVADRLLEAGYHVHGTARSKDKAAWLSELMEKKYGSGKFSIVEVPDMKADGAFDEAVKGVSGICHLASVLSWSNNPDEVIPPTVKGTLNILMSASKEPSIKSVVYTSSSTAALTPKPNEKIIITKDSWNNEVLDLVNNNPSGKELEGFAVYSASKTAAERAFWETVASTKPPFQCATVLPNANFGPILKPGGELSASTGSWPIQILDGDKTALSYPPQWMVNVQDDARLHVAALIDPACNGQRIFAFAEPYNTNDILAVARKVFPGRQLPEDTEGLGRDLSEIPNQEAEALLRKHFGKGFSGLEESLRENYATVKG